MWREQGRSIWGENKEVIYGERTRKEYIWGENKGGIYGERTREEYMGRGQGRNI